MRVNFSYHAYQLGEDVEITIDATAAEFYNIDNGIHGESLKSILKYIVEEATKRCPEN